MKLRYTLPASADLELILDYIATHSPQGARNVQHRIEMLTNLLLSHPRMGRITEDPDIRRLTASPYPYFIFYELTGDEIIIHQIRHTSRRPI